jgi:hypothetical protein
MAESDHENRDISANKLIILFKLTDLKRFLFYNLGMKLLPLDKDAVAIETDEFFFL